MRCRAGCGTSQVHFAPTERTGLWDGLSFRYDNSVTLGSTACATPARTRSKSPAWASAVALRAGGCQRERSVAVAVNVARVARRRYRETCRKLHYGAARRGAAGQDGHRGLTKHRKRHRLPDEPARASGSTEAVSTSPRRAPAPRKATRNAGAPRTRTLAAHPRRTAGGCARCHPARRCCRVARDLPVRPLRRCRRGACSARLPRPPRMNRAENTAHIVASRTVVRLRVLPAHVHAEGRLLVPRSAFTSWLQDAARDRPAARDEHGASGTGERRPPNAAGAGCVRPRRRKRDPEAETRRVMARPRSGGGGPCRPQRGWDPAPSTRVSTARLAGAAAGAAGASQGRPSRRGRSRSCPMSVKGHLREARVAADDGQPPPVINHDVFQSLAAEEMSRLVSCCQTWTRCACVCVRARVWQPHGDVA